MMREYYDRHYDGRLIDALERIVETEPAYDELNKAAANFS